ncbi:sigma factor-like helix-turn-helix DNA-binding protein [Nocardioides sp. W7]|uniref:sigma factor-like helix-turn-helix DNA-binding protein n=1 Tax=Nocardioides sp. W7 TaxID=2931390 RepID=UPI001FD56252|nr:sigma factor-like helix-turn-helix DNA-binding protein [Nocardioides sp. W7]
MASEPEREPGAPGASVEPVQRDSDANAVPLDWLREPEHIALAETIDRMAGDVDLVTVLALQNYEGPDYDYFATEMAKYGMAVFGAWIFHKTVFEKCRARGYGLPALDRPFTSDEIDELKGETVAKALHHFRVDVLMKRKWDSTKGATLRTYFIGQCIIRFANIYRQWYGNEARFKNGSRVDDDQFLIDVLGAGTANTAKAAIDRSVIEQALAQVKDPRVKRAMLLTANGRSQAEIAAELNITVKAVERMLANERMRQRGRWAG